MSTELGRAAGYEALQHRQSMVPLFAAAIEGKSNPLLSGLLGVMCDALDSCQAGGVSFDWRNDRARNVAEALPSARRLLLAAMCQSVDQEAWDVLSALASAIYSARDMVSVSYPETQEKEPPVTLVQIIGMPARISEAAVHREDGAIVGSRNTERDAA